MEVEEEGRTRKIREGGPMLRWQGNRRGYEHWVESQRQVKENLPRTWAAEVGEVGEVGCPFPSLPAPEGKMRLTIRNASSVAGAVLLHLDIMLTATLQGRQLCPLCWGQHWVHRLSVTELRLWTSTHLWTARCCPRRAPLSNLSLKTTLWNEHSLFCMARNGDFEALRESLTLTASKRPGCMWGGTQSSAPSILPYGLPKEVSSSLNNTPLPISACNLWVCVGWAPDQQGTTWRLGWCPTVILWLCMEWGLWALKITIWLYDVISQLLSIYPKKSKALIQKDMCTPMFIAALCTIAKIQSQPKCPLRDKQVRKMRYIYLMEYYTAIKGMWSCHLRQHRWT